MIYVPIGETTCKADINLVLSQGRFQLPCYLCMVYKLFYVHFTCTNYQLFLSLQY